MIRQRTLKHSIQAIGVGLHTGQSVNLIIHPAAIDAGIVFRRIDCDPFVEIPARTEYVSNTELATSISHAGVTISTVEHLMATLCGLGIDNAIIDVDSSEVPIMDGSSSPFVFLLESAGIALQDAAKKMIRVKKRIAVQDEDKWAALEPHTGFAIDLSIAFDYPVFEHMETHVKVNFSSTSFIKEICRARTFGFESDIEALRKRNLALGGSLDNAVVLNQKEVINKEGLRSSDELVCHKMLDVMGDLYLLGHTLIGQYSGHKTGHAINNKLSQTLLADPDAWEIFVCDEQADDINISFIDPIGAL